MANLICSNACRPAYLCKQTYRGNRLSMPAIQLKQRREQFIKLKFQHSATASGVEEAKIVKVKMRAETHRKSTLWSTLTLSLFPFSGHWSRASVNAHNNAVIINTAYCQVFLANESAIRSDLQETVSFLPTADLRSAAAVICLFIYTLPHSGASNKNENKLSNQVLSSISVA